jgi:hypothetical protein
LILLNLFVGCLEAIQRSAQPYSFVADRHFIEAETYSFVVNKHFIEAEPYSFVVNKHFIDAEPYSFVTDKHFIEAEPYPFVVNKHFIEAEAYPFVVNKHFIDAETPPDQDGEPEKASRNLRLDRILANSRTRTKSTRSHERWRSVRGLHQQCG